MAFPPASPKDHLVAVLNPITGELDMVQKFNPDRIVTNQLNSAGQPRMIWNPTTNTFIADGPDIVVDNNGDVVTT